MTRKDLEKLAQLVADKILEEFDNRIQQDFKPMTPKEFFEAEVDGFGNIKHPSKKDMLKAQLIDLEAKRAKLLADEKYELVIELNEIYERIKKEYDKL